MTLGPDSTAHPAPSSGPFVPHRPLPPHVNPFRKDARLADTYDTHIEPVWNRPFAALLSRHIAALSGKTSLLQVMCHTGNLSLHLLSRFPTARLIAIDPSETLVHVTRTKAGSLVGKRLFLRTDPCEPRLLFDEAAFDLVVSNLGLAETAEPPVLLRELARVAKPGSQVLATLPLRGTYAEIYSLFQAELHEREASLPLLAAHVQSWPSEETVRAWANAAGLTDVELTVVPFSLLFGGAADLYYAPVIEYGPLFAWRSLFAHDPTAMQEVLLSLRGKIEAHCAPVSAGKSPRSPALRRPFVLTVRAACLSARRPL